MTGYIVLEGGAEFGGGMAAPDRRSLELAGGPDAPVAIIPAAAAPDNNHGRAGNNGRRWFESLGARRVQVVPLIDSASAADGRVVEILDRAKLIYLLGGFTHYLCQTLQGSPAWQAICRAHANGAVVNGSSAGAMVLCESYYHPQAGTVQPGLGMVPNACVLPHYNTFGRRWVETLRRLLPQVTLVGIDEGTGMVNDGPQGTWTVHGEGTCTIHTPSGVGLAVGQGAQAVSL